MGAPFRWAALSSHHDSNPVGLERPMGLDLPWGLRAAHLKGVPKVGPTRAHLGAPTRAIKGGEGAPPSKQP